MTQRRELGGAGPIHAGAARPEWNAAAEVQPPPAHPRPQAPAWRPGRREVCVTLLLWKVAFPHSVISLTQV